MEPEKFDAAGITLEYMEYNYPEYPQLYPPYEPYVSILDLIVHDRQRRMLDICEQVRGNDHDVSTETQQKLNEYFSEKLEDVRCNP